RTACRSPAPESAERGGCNAGRPRRNRALSPACAFPESSMSSSPLRLLALAIATALMVSAIAPAEAAKKKTQRTAQPRAASRPAPLPVKQDKAAQLNRIYDEYWDASMRLNPLQATFQGDARFNDQLPNF